MMRREFEVFDSCLKTLPGREYRITYDYIHKDRKVSEIAEGEQRNDQAFRENESRRSNEGTINKMSLRKENPAVKHTNGFMPQTADCVSGWVLTKIRMWNPSSITCLTLLVLWRKRCSLMGQL